MKDTVLKHHHIELGARLVEFAGYNMPLEYSGVIKEHMAVREVVGIFDVSHMGEFWIKGDGALPLLDKITTNNVGDLKVGHAQYTVMPNGNGGIIDDLIIYRYDDKKYMAVVNASNIEKDWQWINEKNIYQAELENASDNMSLIALQGPKAKKILQELTEFNLDLISSFQFATTRVAGRNNVIVSNTGYTGAGGFEIYCFNADADTLWSEIMKVGEPEGLIPAGLAARDTLRLEMGYCLYGNDIDDSTSPLEAGLGWIVKLNKESDFIDKEFLKTQKEKGIKKKLIGFEMLERGIPRHDYQIVDEHNNIIGKVTSGTMSPVLQKGIGMGYVDNMDYAKVGETVFLQVRNKTLKASVVKFPFI